MGSYGHDSNGFNIKNVRELTSRPARWPPVTDQQRPEHRWKQEVLEHVAVSGTHGNLSARLRDSSKKLEEAARQAQETSVAAVETSLAAHLAQLQGVIASLTTTKAAVAAETAGLGRAARRLRAMLAHLERQLALNGTRSKARLSRPPRERTLDAVSAALGAQEALLGRLAGQLRGALAGVEAEAGKLQGAAAGLDKDLEDKMLAHEVDAAVLGVPRLEGVTHTPATPGTLATAATTTAAPGATTATAPGALTVPKSPPAAGRSTKPSTSPAAVAAAAVVRRDPARAPYKTPSTWSAATQRRLDEARVLVGNAQRMRAAARKLLTQTQEAARAAEVQVESALAQRATEVGGAAAALQARLAAVAAERQRAEQQRDSLVAALADTEAPLAQLQARVALRGQRPDGELVEDGVEAALTAEALALHAATTSLASKLAAVEEAIAALDANAAALAANLEDKEVAAELEGRVAALDGRRSPGVPRTPSMLSVATADSLVSAMTGLGPSASRAATPSGHHSHPQQQQQQQQQQEGSPTGSTGAALPPPCAAALSQAAAHGGGDAASEAGSCRSGVAAQHKRPGTASVVSCGSSVRSSVVADLQQQLAQAQAERAALQQQLEAIKAEKGLGHSSPAGKSKPGPSNLGKAAGGSGSSCASVASRPMTTAALARLQGPGSSA